MATWVNFCRTEQGKALDAKLLGGETTLLITKAMSGAERVNPVLLPSLTELPAPKQKLMISDRLTDESTTQVTLPVLLSNEGLAQSYKMQMLGIYAQDPDLGEILYMVSQVSGEEGEEIPAETVQPAFSVQWNLCLKVSDAASVTVEVPQTGLLTESTADRRYVKTAQMQEALAGKASKPVTEVTALAAEAWNQADKIYSFEEEYPSDEYDVEMWLNSSATDEQAEAYNNAQIESVFGSNAAKCRGNVPAIDIPVILKVVRK